MATLDPQRIPHVVNGHRARAIGNSSFFLVNPSKEVINELNKVYLHVRDYIWMLQPTWDDNWLDLISIVKGGTVGIVGKGPSLDYLSVNDLGDDAAVIGINEAIHKIETLHAGRPTYLMQQDGRLKGTCGPAHAHRILSATAAYHYPHDGRTLLFQPAYFGGDSSTLTAVCAIRMAAKFGAKALRLYAFDACTTGNTHYAKCVGYNPDKWGEADSRFLKHRAEIDKAISVSKLPVTFITPANRELLIAHTVGL